MTLTNKQRTLVKRTLVSLVSTALLLALAIFGGRYRVLVGLFLPIGLWFSLKLEPKEMKVRPAIQVLGWMLLGVVVIAIVAAAISIAAGR